MSKMKEAYKNEDKAPRKGVKADDADEYKSKGSNYNKSVEKSKAYKAQDHAPKGRGSRGPSQSDGGPIRNYDKSVEKGGAYSAQEKAKEHRQESGSLGFKMGENSSYLGHFGKEEFLRKGHNDGGKVDYGSSSPSPDESLSDTASKYFKKMQEGNSQKEEVPSQEDKYESIRKKNKENIGY